jgi:hypothetical protein
MIGSLMSRMADAEKLSIPQLNQAVKNGTIPAYVGVPLIQEKMRADQAAKAMVAQTQAQPPLARQVMEQADMMSGLEKLQSNLPEEGFAGGGIVAFADGGVSTPDDDEDEEKNLMSRLMAGITSLKQGVSDRIPSSDAIKQSIVSKMPSGMRSAMYDGPQKGDYVAPPAERRARGGHKYENMVAAEAERIGLDPNIAVHALYKETGNLKNPESARSRAGAIGVMQLMPRTAKELGVDPLIPEENIRGGVMYLKQMYDKYQDPTLALAAYNAGPGRVDRALKSGQGIASLPRETQNYVIARNMAEGGSVKHFVKGDLVMGDFGEARRASLPSGSTVVDDFGNMVEKDGKKIKPPIKPSMYSRVLRKVPYLGAALTTAEGIQALVDSDTGTASEDLDPIAAMQGTQGGYARPERKKDVYAELKESTRAESAPQKPQFNFPPQGGIGPTDLELGRNAPAPAPAAPEAYKEPAADQGISDIKNLLKQRMEESGKQKRIDAYMSLLQAGLGMMGGSSPFASVNIGQGAAQGVAAQMAARKSQVADENAILTGQLGLSRAELYEKMRRDALRQQAERTAGELKIKEGNLDVNRQKALGQQRKNYLTAQKQFMDQGGQLEIENRYKTQYGKNWKNDPNHLRNFNLELKARINELAGSIGDDDIPLSSSR